MKRLLLLLAMSAIALIALVSCKDNFEEINPNPNPDPTPVEQKDILNVNVDFPGFENVISFCCGTLLSRQGLNCNLGEQIMELDNSKAEWRQTLSITLPQYLNLRGKTCEIMFVVRYIYEGVIQRAELVRNVTFSDTGVTNLGNIGFSNYEWRTHPPLLRVIVPDNLKLYASN